MLRYSVSLQTATHSLAVSCPLLFQQLWAVQLDFWATRAACFATLLQSVAADGGRRQSILDFRFWILD
jgi:hypothetical protein